MRWIGGAAGLTLMVLAACSAISSPGAASGRGEPRVAVVAELFTSEGCSSCPPADRVLIHLAETQPVPGVEIIALGEHVDYWNRLGWRDPFSSAAYSQRQSEYARRVFRTGGIYTPQMVVDGRKEFIGSDLDEARRVIAAAGLTPKARVRVAAAGPGEAAQVPVHIGVEGLPAPPGDDRFELVVAVTEDGLVTNVRRGENSGRRLRHGAVVRSLVTVDVISDHTAPYQTRTAVPLSPDWDRRRLRIVAFVQAAASRAIVGAAATDLQGSS